MTFKKLALILCRMEGKKKQVDITQMRETLACLRMVFKKDPLGVLKVLYGSRKS